MSTDVMHAGAGERVDDTIVRAIRQAQLTDEPVVIEHNGVQVEVHASSRQGDLYTIWWLRRQLLRAEHAMTPCRASDVLKEIS